MVISNFKESTSNLVEVHLIVTSTYTIPIFVVDDSLTYPVR